MTLSLSEKNKIVISCVAAFWGVLCAQILFRYINVHFDNKTAATISFLSAGVFGSALYYLIHGCLRVFKRE